MSQTNTIPTRNLVFTLGSITTFFFISISVMSFAACKPSPQSATKTSDITKQEARQLINTDFRHDKWQTTNVQLFQTGGQSPIDVSAQTTIYRYGTVNNGSPTSVIAFKIPGTNQSWIGPEQDAYLKSGNLVLGARFNADLTYLYWRQSMHQPMQTANLVPTGLSEDVGAFDSGIDVETLFDANASFDIEDDYVTDIESKIGSSFFLMGPQAANMGAMKVISIVAENNNLKIEIKNLSTDATANVWIDLDSRNVTKATKNGTQVFPVPIAENDTEAVGLKFTASVFGYNVGSVKARAGTCI